MKNSRPFIIPGFVGLILMIYGLVLMNTFPKQAPYLAEGFTTPIIYFEFVETIEETQQLFGMIENRQPDNQIIYQMNLGNKLDFIYAIIYSLFLFLFVRMAGKISKYKLITYVNILVIIACIMDFNENFKLLSITEKLVPADFQEELTALHLYTWIKWGSLAIIFASLSMWFFMGNFLSKIFAFILFSPLILAVLSYLSPGFYTEIFAKSIMLMFVVLIAYSLFYKVSSSKNLVELD